MNGIDRREFVWAVVSAAALAACGRSAGNDVSASPAVPENHGQGNLASDSPSRFRAIYNDADARARFYLFLTNVYHILPEAPFQQLITESCRLLETDREIYNRVREQVPHIKPFLTSIRYALPALANQKREIARETARLVGDRVHAERYVEIGTPGRYVRALRNEMFIGSEVFLVNPRSPEFTLEDVAERGQLARVGEFTELNDYDPLDTRVIPSGRIDFLTNYIGLHHSPRPKLDAFVDSIRTSLRPGGIFVLRDHDVDSAQRDTLVALAHDVFNAGLNVDWSVNARELRYFKSVPWIENYLSTHGFRQFGPRIAQQGDPTKNLLLAFERI